ncbi:MAG: extracellular solute-binding protein [Treponema sp.]|nr:extracellular solute-binding protein [Treponema sp.]
MKYCLKAIAAAILFSALLGSCVRNDAAGAGKKIIIFQSKVEIIPQLEEAARAYSAERGIEAEVWGTTGDDYYQRLRTRIANNQGPSLFSLAPGSEVVQMANYLETMDNLPFINDIAASLVIRDGARPVGIPYTMEGFGIVYNKSLINPAEVKNYDSFVKMLKDKKAKGINGFGLSQESYFLIGHILNHPFAVRPDMEAFMEKLSKGEVKMADTQEFREFARFYAAIRDNSYNPLEVNYDRECGDFATGKTAAIHQGNWAYGMFSDYDIGFEMGLLPFPLGGNDRLAVSVPAAWCVNSQIPPTERALAKDFLTWLYTSSTGTRFITEEFGFIPVVKGIAGGRLDPLSAEVSRYASEGKTIPWATNLYPAGIVDVYLVPVAQQFFTSKQTPEQFLAALDAAWAKATGNKGSN